MDHVPLAALASGRAPASADSRAMMTRPLAVMNLDLKEEESAALLRPAVIREGQLHPCKPTNPPARSIVSSVPIAEPTSDEPLLASAVEPPHHRAGVTAHDPFRTLASVDSNATYAPKP